jgi:hypothetical protein
MTMVEIATFRSTSFAMKLACKVGSLCAVSQRCGVTRDDTRIYPGISTLVYGDDNRQG